MGSGSSGYGIGGDGGGGTPRSDPPFGVFDGGYNGGTAAQHGITDNLETLKDAYQYREGYFGKASSEKNTKVRKYQSEDPDSTAREFYEKASKGGEESPLDNSRGVQSKMKDGTVVTYRPNTKDGTPAVTINAKESDNRGELKPYQKIHFEHEKG